MPKFTRCKMSPFWEEWLPSFMNWCNIHPRIVFSPIYGPFCTFLGLKKSFVTIIALIGSISKWLYFPPWFSPVWAISCLFVLFGIEKILCHNICTYWFNFEFLIFFYERQFNQAKKLHIQMPSFPQVWTIRWHASEVRS